MTVRRPRIRAGDYAEHRGRQVLQPDPTLACHDAGSLQDITQFPHIARPIIAMKYSAYLPIQACNARAVFLVQILQHDIGNQRDIFFVFTQRRKHDLENTQAIVEFFAQMRSEFLTGRGKYPRVHRDFVLTAEPPHAQILENAQQLWLGRLRHLADFIEKQSAPVSLLKAAGRTLHGARKRASLVAEQLALDRESRAMRPH